MHDAGVTLGEDNVMDLNCDGHVIEDIMALACSVHMLEPQSAPLNAVSETKLLHPSMHLISLLVFKA